MTASKELGCDSVKRPPSREGSDAEDIDFESSALAEQNEVEKKTKPVIHRQDNACTEYWDPFLSCYAAPDLLISDLGEQM